ncbi:MAG: type II toxin-antitoxin system VapC family toxin [Promethearchaeota archaeon]
MKIALDTNVFIALMNKEANAHYCELIFNAIDKKMLQAVISTIVVAEVTVGFYQTNNMDGKQKFHNKISVDYEILPVTLDIAEKGAELRAKMAIKLPDALIYASAEFGNVDVLISNDHPFRKKSKLKINSPQEFVENYFPLGKQE